MNSLDYVVLLSTILGIAGYGAWQTRGRRSLDTYLKGTGKTGWLVIGLSVMATQASAITFLSTPGQGYESGLGFVQNYFGAPFALIVIAAVFLPIYRRLKVYTAYEFLGQRFDAKTRLLAAALFLLQRGLGAGITVYAPAIVLSTVMEWRLDLTIVCSGLVVIVYTVIGGSDAVSLTQKYQISIIFAGMLTALIVLLTRLPTGLSPVDALTVAGGFHKLEAVDFSIDPNRRYTLWTGLLGGMFLALSYFGTDQSQVQRYISGASLRESRLGLMFNAVFKIPMQFLILMLGALMFVFYQFTLPPVFFNEAAWNYQVAHGKAEQLEPLQADFAAVHAEKQQHIQKWLDAKHAGDAAAEANARNLAMAAQQRGETIRTKVKKTIHEADPHTSENDADYVFISFILRELPHGAIGLLVAAFFAATLSSKAAELNALSSTTTVDIYRHLVKREATDSHYVTASKCFTVFWGLVAIGFALFATLKENLVQAVNIVGSIFYGVVLALFLVAFFVRWVSGTAVFWAAVVSQLLVFELYFTLKISYLWFNVIGAVYCVLLSMLFQAFIDQTKARAKK